MLMHRLHPHQSPWGERPLTGHVVDPCRSVNNKRGREKRVTWATEDRIRQVLLFVSDEELPISQSLLLGRLDIPRSPEVEKVLPPGFEASSAKRLRLRSALEESMPVGRLWETPQKCVPHPAWWIANGSGSLEVAVQQQREPRELEAVYPRLSSIPHSPAEPCDHPLFCDASIPEIPLIPLEDEDDCEDEDMSGNENSNNHDATAGVLDPHCVSHGKKHLQGVDPDIAAAVAAALMVVKDPGVRSRVDEDLLIKLLKNPTLLQTLSSTTDKFVQRSVVASSPRTPGEDTMTLDVPVPLRMPSIYEGKVDEPQNSMRLSSESKEALEATSNIPFNTDVQPWILPKHGSSNKATFPCTDRMSVSGIELIVEQQSKVTRPLIERSVNASSSIGWSDLSSDHETGGIGTKVCPQTKEVSPPSGQSNQLTSLSHSKHPVGVMDIPDSHVPPFRTESLARACLDHTASLSSQPQLSRHGEKLRGSPPAQAYFANSNGDPQRNLDVRNHSVLNSSFPQIANGKSRKQCVFFNTPRGCRKGASCEFLHQTDKSANQSYHSASLVQ